MNILLGLPVGVEGKGEIVEIELTEESFNFEKFIRRSKDFLPEGLKFKGFIDLEPKETLLSKIKTVTYTIVPFTEYDLSPLKEEKLISRKEVILKDHIALLKEENGRIEIATNVINGNILNIQDILNWIGLNLGTAKVCREALIQT